MKNIFVVLLGLAAFSNAWAEPAADVEIRYADVALGGRKVAVTFAIFSSQNFVIRVIDNAGEGDQAKFSNLAEAMEFSKAAAGCNGGFFNRRPFSPVGGMVSGGKSINSIDPKSWMKGLLVVRRGQLTLEPIDKFQNSEDVADLLQSGPWLVRNGKPEVDSNRGPLARRTFICHDNRGRWAIGTSEPCSLFELAMLLRSGEVVEVMDVENALNLDGGPSTGLWVRQTEGNFYQREKWPVRNYVGIFRRSP